MKKGKSFRQKLGAEVSAQSSDPSTHAGGLDSVGSSLAETVHRAIAEGFGEYRRQLVNIRLQSGRRFRRARLFN